MANIVEFLNEVVFDADVLSVQSGYAATPLDDGYMCKLSALVTGERDLYTVVPVADITVDDMVMVVGAEVYVDGNGIRIPLHNKASFTYAGDRPVRAYRPRTGMRFKISNTAISGTPVAGQYLVAQNSSFGLAASSSAGTGKVIFEVEETGSTVNIFTGKTLVPATIVRVKKGL